MIEIRTADVLEEIKKIPDISVHLIFTDPAYWTLNKWREVGTTTRLGGHGKITGERTHDDVFGCSRKVL